MSQSGADDEQSVSEQPLFTFGAHPIPQVRRQWDRAARPPRKRQQRKGTKVWKRPAQPHNEDALASAQLLQELEISANVHATKRQRIQHMPAVPVRMQTLAPYAPTMSDTPKSVLRRKPVKEKTNTQSPFKRMSESSWLSPITKLFSRRSSTGLTNNVAEEAPEEVDDNDDILVEASFLDAVDLHGSTMFDKGTGEEESLPDAQSDESASESDAKEELITANSHEEDDEEVQSEDSEGNDATSRLADAGNTGIVRIGEISEEDGDDDDDVSATAIDNVDYTTMQEQVTELLKTPPRDAEAAADEIPAKLSFATETDSASTTSPGIQNADTTVPELNREDTDSTVAFDDPAAPGLLFGTEPLVPNLTGMIKQDRTTTRGSRRSVAFDMQGEDKDDSSSPVVGQWRDQEALQTFQSAEGEKDAEEREGEDSADELYGGSPTLRRIFLSPSKSTSADPTSPKKARAALRLSDDTTYLNDFLSRVRSQAAARSREPVLSPVKTTTPTKPTRVVLGEIDTNSPTPSPNVTPKRGSVREETRSSGSSNRENGSPVKLPKTPAARLLLSSNLESPETPDELLSSAPDKMEDGPMTRRSGRSRLPAPSRPPLNAPNAIPLRRADGDPPVLQRSEAQRLARATAANTRRNKGAARFPKQVIEILEARDSSPVKTRGAVKNRKGQNVDWDHRLVYFLEDTGKEVKIDADGKLIETENGKEVKRRVRIVKGEKVVDEEDVINAQPEASGTENEPLHQESSSINVAKEFRKVKTISKTAASEKPTGAPKLPLGDLKSASAKPRRAKAPTTTIGIRGTPAVKRMLSVEATTPSLASSKRRTKRA